MPFLDTLDGAASGDLLSARAGWTVLSGTSPLAVAVAGPPAKGYYRPGATGNNTTSLSYNANGSATINQKGWIKLRNQGGNDAFDLACVAVRCQTGAATAYLGGIVNQRLTIARMVAGARTDLFQATAGTLDNAYPDGCVITLVAQGTSHVTLTLFVTLADGTCIQKLTFVDKSASAITTAGKFGFAVQTNKALNDAVPLQIDEVGGSEPLAVSVAHNHASVYRSPFNWGPVSAGSASQTVEIGAYEYHVTDAADVEYHIDTSMYAAGTVNGATTLLVARYRVDNGPWREQEIAAGSDRVTLMSGGNVVSRRYEIYVNGIGKTNSWISGNANFQPWRTSGWAETAGATTAVPAKRAKRMVMISDSRAAGIGANNFVQASNYSNAQDANRNFAAKMAIELDCELGNLGHEGAGYTKTGLGVMPAFSGSYDKLWDAANRDWASEVPDYVFMMSGANDQIGGATANQYRDAIAALVSNVRAKAGANALIFVMADPAGIFEASAVAGVAASGDAKCFSVSSLAYLRQFLTSPAVIDPTGLKYNEASTDGVHLTDRGSSLFAGHGTRIVQSVVDGLSIVGDFPPATAVLAGFTTNGVAGRYVEANRYLYPMGQSFGVDGVGRAGGRLQAAPGRLRCQHASRRLLGYVAGARVEPGHELPESLDGPGAEGRLLWPGCRPEGNLRGRGRWRRRRPERERTHRIMTNVAQETKDLIRSIGTNSPVVGGAAVVAGPGDQGPYRALWVSTAGTVTVRTIDGSVLSFGNVPAGGFLSVMCDRVTACPAGTVGVW